MNQRANPRSEFFRTPAVAIGLRLAVAIATWWCALVLLDDAAPTDSCYMTNLRTGLWLYLVEILVANYFGKGKSSSILAGNVAAPVSNSFRRIAEPWSQQAPTTFSQVTLNLFWRVPALMLGTALMVAWCGEGCLNRAAVLFPPLIYAVAHRSLKACPRIEHRPQIRGTHIGNNEDVRRRAPLLNALAQLELAEKLPDNHESPDPNQASL